MWRRFCEGVGLFALQDGGRYEKERVRSLRAKFANVVLILNYNFPLFRQSVHYWRAIYSRVFEIIEVVSGEQGDEALNVTAVMSYSKSIGIKVKNLRLQYSFVLPTLMHWTQNIGKLHHHWQIVCFVFANQPFLRNVIRRWQRFAKRWLPYKIWTFLISVCHSSSSDC